MPFSSEILIGINIRGAADWLSPVEAEAGGMSNEGRASNLLNVAELS